MSEDFVFDPNYNYSYDTLERLVTAYPHLNKYKLLERSKSLCRRCTHEVICYLPLRPDPGFDKLYASTFEILFEDEEHKQHMKKLGCKCT